MTPSTTSFLLITVLTMLSQAATQTCPPEYCSFCSKEVVHCSGRSFAVGLENFKYLLHSLQGTVKDTLHEFLLQRAHIPDVRPVNIGAYLPELRQLSLIDCDIAYINQNTLKSMTNLAEFSLRNNSIKNFSFAILEHTKNIQLFDLSSNSIMRLENPTRIPYPQMRVLNLANNYMSNIEDGVFEYFPNLEKLILRNNPLHGFTNRTFRGLGALLTLDLSQTQILKIHDGYFLPLPSLETLDLTHAFNSMIDHFQDWTFRGLEKVKWLSLMDNNIGNSICDSLRHTGLKNVRYLDLSGNIITQLKNDSFTFLENLQILKLSHMRTPMHEIPSLTFEGLKKLEYLDLQGNYLTTLPLAAMQPIKFAKISIAYGNHFSCNCSLIPFQKDITKGVLKTDIQCRIHREKLFLSQMTTKDLGCTAPSMNDGKNKTVHTWVGVTSAMIVCNASSTEDYPRVTFRSKRGDPVPSNKIMVFTITNMTILPDGRKHFTTVKRIFIRHIVKENAGLVECSGSNDYGTAASYIELSVQERDQPMNKWTIGVVAALITILAIIIVIAIAVTLQRKKARERRLANARREMRSSQNGSEAQESRGSDDVDPPPAEPQPVISETSL